MNKATRLFTALAALFLSVLLLCVANGERHSEDSREASPASSDFMMTGRTVTFYIALSDGPYSSGRNAVGFQYSVITRFGKAEGYTIDVLGHYQRTNPWDLLVNGGIDIMVADSRQEIPFHYRGLLTECLSVSGFKWVTRKNDIRLMQDIDLWLGAFSKTDEYAFLEHEFSRSYRLDRFLEENLKTDRISPYDELVKKESRRLGWDWRLLSAVIFKESRFSMAAYSRRGAIGLMQVMPSTAAQYGIDDLFNPAQNIRAGTSHLRTLEKIYEGMGLDSVNVVKFTLAAYNAGEGRINDCMRITQHFGGNPEDWESVVMTIPKMRDPEFYAQVDSVRHGRFSGKETILYVEDVLMKYQQYREVVNP